MLRLPAYTEMPDDLVCLGIDNVHGVAAAVGDVDARRQIADGRAHLARVRLGVNILGIHLRGHSSQRLPARDLAFRGGQAVA